VLIKNPDNIKGSDGKEIFAERKNILNLMQNKVGGKQCICCCSKACQLCAAPNPSHATETI
jgi:hypothetical protein